MELSDRIHDNQREAELSPQSYEGFIATSAASIDDEVYVVLNSDPEHRVGPCPWSRHGNSLPQRGDKCLVLFDDTGDPWIPVWWPVPAGSQEVFPLTSWAAGHQRVTRYFGHESGPTAGHKRLRIGYLSRDTLNWASGSGLEIIIRSIYYGGGGYTRSFFGGYAWSNFGADMSTLHVLEATGANQIVPKLGAEETVSGTIKRREVYVDIPEYTQCSVEVSAGAYAEVEQPFTAGGQIEFDGSVSAGSVGNYHDGSVHLGGHLRFMADDSRITFPNSSGGTPNQWGVDNSNGIFRVFREDYLTGLNGAVRFSIADNGEVDMQAALRVIGSIDAHASGDAYRTRLGDIYPVTGVHAAGVLFGSGLDTSIFREAAGRVNVGGPGHGAMIGASGHGTGYTEFRRDGMHLTNGYTILAAADGTTFVNASSGKHTRFREGNIDRVRIPPSTEGFAFGPDADVILYRSSPGVLYSTGHFVSALNIHAQMGSAWEVAMGRHGPSGEAGVYFGSAGDTRLFRRASDQLGTEGDMCFEEPGKGPIIRSNSTQRWRIVVSDAGVLSTVATG